jgi:hypothetical protein
MICPTLCSAFKSSSVLLNAFLSCFTFSCTETSVYLVPGMHNLSQSPVAFHSTNTYNNFQPTRNQSNVNVADHAVIE